ncbi:MAG: diguanylate cyclase [Acidobacteriota bacterium]
MPESYNLAELLIWVQENAFVLLVSGVVLFSFVRWAVRGPSVPGPSGPGPIPSAPAGARSSQSLKVLEGGDPQLVRSLRKTIEDLKSESSSLFSYFMLLPDLTKRINSIKEKRKVAPLMIEMLDYIFEPKKIIIFYAVEAHKVLFVGGLRGFERTGSMKLGDLVKYGEGRIGWIARSGAQDAMDRTNFELEERSAGASFDIQAHANFEMELCAPIRHNNALLGVISVGGIRRRPPKAEKRMVEMVADLGAMALTNIFQFNKIQAAANTDGLTQLHNKGYFQKRFTEELTKAQQGRYPVSIFIFDIDYFKKYNDANGHLAGDECLKRVAKAIRDAAREDDVAARYGGEEFIIILPNTDRDNAMLAAEKFRAAIEAETFTPPHPVNPGGKVTISGGIGTYPDDGMDATSIISKADAGLYEAKKKGRNRIGVCTSQPELSPAGTHSP